MSPADNYESLKFYNTDPWSCLTRHNHNVGWQPLSQMKSIFSLLIENVAGYFWNQCCHLQLDVFKLSFLSSASVRKHLLLLQQDWKPGRDSFFFHETVKCCWSGLGGSLLRSVKHLACKDLGLNLDLDQKLVLENLLNMTSTYGSIQSLSTLLLSVVDYGGCD